jgi:peroxisomal 3,2-trans-enoyl-CoA isomerase
VARARAYSQREFVDKFIRFPKILVGAVNGPAVGIAVTTLSFCDAIYASTNATFATPFTSLGQSPEACSSYLFPRIMGPKVANEVLLFGRSLTADEAKSVGFVTDVIGAREFKEEVAKRTRAIAALPPQSLRLSKGIIQATDMETLCKVRGAAMLLCIRFFRDAVWCALAAGLAWRQVNVAECDLLRERWVSDECIGALTKFMTRKAK